MSTPVFPPPSWADVQEAAERIRPYIHRTPLLASRSISQRAGSEVRLKCENLQRIGAFKIRGALNALLQLPDEQKRIGVVAFSSGNHAQGVALAARMLGIPATIVMPEGSVRIKAEATAGYGAHLVQAGVTDVTRGEVARQIAADTGAALIPPFDHPHIIAGAATVGLEITQDWPEVRNILVPLGGGGLLAGVALAATSMISGINVYGVEPEAGNDGQQSFAAGHIVRIESPNTIADGARTLALGETNFAIIRNRVRAILTVNDEELMRSMVWGMQRTKLVIEPTGALALAALLENKIQVRDPVAVVLSGGNLDFSIFAHG